MQCEHCHETIQARFFFGWTFDENMTENLGNGADGSHQPHPAPIVSLADYAALAWLTRTMSAVVAALLAIPERVG